MDKAAPRMHMYRVFSSVENDNSDKNFVRGGENNKNGRVVAPVSGFHCWHCGFPKHTKRSVFAYHSALCPCDVDITLEDGPDSGACSKSEKCGLLDVAEVGECQKYHITTLHPICSPSSNMKSAYYRSMRCEDQWRIDQLNGALSSRRINHSTSVDENMNNSSSASYNDYILPSANDDFNASNTCTPVTVKQESVRKRRDTDYVPCSCSFRKINNPHQPMVFQQWGDFNALCQRRPRYQPYNVRGCQRYRQLHKILRTKYHKTNQANCDQVGGRLSKENERFTSGQGRICRGYNRDMDLGRRCYRMGCCCQRKQRRVVRYSSPIHRCTKCVKPVWCHFCDQAFCDNPHRRGTSLGSKTAWNFYRHEPCASFGLDFPQNYLTADHELLNCRLSPQEFLCKRAQESAAREIQLEAPHSAGLRSESGLADKDMVRQIVGRNNSCSMGPTRVNSNSFGIITRCNPPTEDSNSDKNEFCLDADPSSPLSSKANTSLICNLSQTPFKFSSPVVALSKSKQKMARLSPFSGVSKDRERSFHLSSKPGDCLHHFLTTAAHCKPWNFDKIQNKSLSVETNASESCKDTEKESMWNTDGLNAMNDEEAKALRQGGCKRDFIAIMEDPRIFTQRQIGSTIERPVCPSRRRAINSRSLTQGCWRGSYVDVGSRRRAGLSNITRGAVCFNLSDTTQRSDKDSTSNNSNVDSTRPINNYSSNQRCTRTPLSGRVVKVEGDGRCLFRSLVTAEHRPLQLGWRDEFGRPGKRELSELETARADQLRARVVAIMSDNMHFYSQLEKGIINADQPMSSNYQRFLDRLRAMSQPSTMPGDLELNAVAMVMERQILVLDTNLAIITSYGHDRFPQSVPLAVRYTRLVADVGHYDAVILNDDQLADICGHCNRTNSGKQQGSPAHGSSSHSDLCGDFRRLTTSGDPQNNDAVRGIACACSRGRCNGNAKLNAKKEYFYLRDSDKSLHSNGLQPVPTLTAKGAAKPADEQRTAEAATSTTRATINWTSNLHRNSLIRNRRKRRTFSNKFTQTDGRLDRIDKSDEQPEWKKHYYQYRYGISKSFKGAVGKKRRASVAFVGDAKRTREMRVRKAPSRYQNINWNSRVRHLKSGISRAHKTGEFKSEGKDSIQSKKLKILKDTSMKKKFSAEINHVYHSTKGHLCIPSAKIASKRVGSWDRARFKNMLVVGTSAETNKSSAKKTPTKYINICSPTRQPRPGKSEEPKPRAVSPSVNRRKRRSVSRRNRSRKRQARPISPGSPHSPLFLSKKPRLPDAFEPVLCRCVLCNTKIEATARDSAKCFMCGRMAHRACVNKESSGGSQGGGDQNYFICSFCVPN